jgi:hypothetical protein
MSVTGFSLKLKDENGTTLLVADSNHTSHLSTGRTSRFVVVCAWCSSMRDAHGRWVKGMPEHIGEQHVVVSHGICEECAEKLLADYYRILTV